MAEDLLKEREGDVVKGMPITAQVGKIRFEEAAALGKEPNRSRSSLRRSLARSTSIPPTRASPGPTVTRQPIQSSRPRLSGVALDLGLGIEVCWPASPQQKGSVENLVGWVKGSFFKQRRFVDEADLRTQLREWLIEVNTVRPSRATREIPSVRLAEERPRLRPVKVAPADLALRIPIGVGPTGMVLHDTHRYSMPPEALGLPGTLYLYRDRVRIVAGRFTAQHDRLWERDAKSTLPEHRAQLVAAVSGKRAKRYLQREHLLALGPPALGYLTELIHRRPKIWVRDVERLHNWLTTYGPDAVRAAFARGLEEHVIGAEYIGHYLAAAVTVPPPISGDGAGRAGDRSWLLGHPGGSIARDEQLSLDLPSAQAATPPPSSVDGGRS